MPEKTRTATYEFVYEGNELVEMNSTMEAMSGIQSLLVIYSNCEFIRQIFTTEGKDEDAEVFADMSKSVRSMLKNAFDFDVHGEHVVENTYLEKLPKDVSDIQRD